MVAAYVVDRLARMLLENAELPDDFLSFSVLRHGLPTRHVSDIDCYIPLERRPSSVPAVF